MSTSTEKAAAEGVAPAPLNEGAAPAAAAPAAEGAAPAEGGVVAQTKSAAKKEAKRLEALAKKALKAPKGVNAAAGTGAKKEKPKKEKEEEEVYVNVTPKGQKKDVSGNMPKSAYNPTAVESAWYDWWMAQGYFQPTFVPGTEHLSEDGKTVIGTPKPAGTFVIPMPPPNVTGSLHCGHALGGTIQDALIRWYRMKGWTVLHVPGYDHAGISTQAVVENRMIKFEGKTRHDYGREKFLEKVWEWKDKYQERITEQVYRLGHSSDWSRVAFTMDDNLSAAVRETFFQLHKKGKIYRANRLVNWCVRLNTTLSNVEVDSKDLTGRTMLSVPGYDPKEKFEFGAITSFAYEIEGSDEKIIVATTRPETMLGDTAIAVHPDDPRYTHLHGKFAKHPFVDRRIPIICDPITVDMAFGTGAVKITPAHDHNDYECGKRHNLEFINLMNDDGTYNANAGPKYQGMKRFHVRNVIIEDLKTAGLYIETKDNPMQVPVCSKSGDIIEAIMKPQWWCDLKDAAKLALDKTESGELKIHPKHCEGEWKHWMAGMQDWCISRQLWWGHRCPAYLVVYDGEAPPDESDNNSWVVGRSEEEAMAIATEKAQGRKFTLKQDEDVLDTWFSSGLWPFSIMGWPRQTEDLKAFYPGSTLVTGWDILTFWVSRMVMLGLVLTDELPFKEVYCHALIRDPEGRKMSKSLGNVIDPLDVIDGSTLEALNQQLLSGNLADKEIIRAKDGQKKLFPKGIPECGLDAFRFTLANYSTGGRDISLKIGDIETYRKFCNKIWNATKFCMVKLGMIDIDGVRTGVSFVPNKTGAKTGKESLCERWILHKLNQATASINADMEARNFYAATESLYSFWLHDLCDVFIEATKPLTTEDAPADVRESALNTIYTCLESGLRLIHPFMPFLSEDLWQRLPRRPEETVESIMITEYPVERSDYEDAQAEKDFDLINSIVGVARSTMAVYGLPTNGKVPDDRHYIIVQTEDAHIAEVVKSQTPIIEAVVKGCRAVQIVATAAEVPAGCGSEQINVAVAVHVPVKGKIDASQEIAKLEKKTQLQVQSADKIKKQESQANYETTIPEDVRAKNTASLKAIEAEIETLRLTMEKFKGLL